ncbi:MAG: hypothetical protein NTV01_15395, partial [Bacteroidia bacterium]|nr:hypothetical protein [Bacteroidia bacterium]
IDVDIQESLEKSLVQTYRNLGFDYLKFFKMDNLSKLAILAAENVLKGTDLYSKTCNDNVAIVLANASSSLVADTNFQHTISDPENYFPSPSLFVYTLPNISIGEICIKYKIFGSNMFFINQKFDASTLYFYVNELFENASTDYCITGWVECNENAYEAFLLLVTKGLSQYKFDINTIDFLYKINK